MDNLNVSILGCPTTILQCHNPRIINVTILSIFQWLTSSYQDLIVYDAEKLEASLLGLLFQSLLHTPLESGTTKYYLGKVL
jgi:hypothetical protein